MSINKDVTFALKNIGVPVSFQTYSGNEETYITFFTYLDKPEEHADDEESVTAYYVQVDIWTKTDYTNLAKEVHGCMLIAHFRKLNFYDLFEDDTRTYHKVMRFIKEVI